MDLASTTALVTGASSGIGAALARALAQRGTTVGIVARREDRLAEVLADCQKTAPDSRMWVHDLDDVKGSERLALEAWDAFGGIGVLVNNAAIPVRHHTLKVTVDEVERAMRVNFLSPARMTLALLPKMMERGEGVIVNVSSMGGRLGIAGEPAYCASKFALCGWSESMAVDLWDTPIKIRLINPGPVDTEIWDAPGNDPADYDGPKVPPEEVAEGIIEAIQGDTFEHYLPDMKSIVEMKTADIDGFMAGVAAFTAQQQAEKA
jgi:short-subunit dehydrogenase